MDATDFGANCFVDDSDLGAVLLKIIQRASECGTKNDAPNLLGYYPL